MAGFVQLFCACKSFGVCLQLVFKYLKWWRKEGAVDPVDPANRVEASQRGEQTDGHLMTHEITEPWLESFSDSAFSIYLCFEKPSVRTEPE